MSKEVVRMKQGMSYSCKEKTIILNVFKYFRKMHSDKCVTEIVRRTAQATGCSEKSIFQFRKEEASPEGFKQPSKTKIRKNININSRFFKYDESVRESIKSIIYQLKQKSIVPSLSIILKNVNSNEKLPNFSLMTLRRLLFDMGFTYEKDKTRNKSILVEKNHKDNIDVTLKSQQPNDISPTKPIVSHNLSTTKANNHNSQQPMAAHISESSSQNQIYVPNQNHRQIHVHIPRHENHVLDPMSVGFQHGMILNHRMPHSIHPIHHHNMGFIHQTHNSLIQH